MKEAARSLEALEIDKPKPIGGVGILETLRVDTHDPYLQCINSAGEALAIIGVFGNGEKIDDKRKRSVDTLDRWGRRRCDHCGLAHRIGIPVEVKTPKNKVVGKPPLLQLPLTSKLAMPPLT